MRGALLVGVVTLIACSYPVGDYVVNRAQDGSIDSINLQDSGGGDDTNVFETDDTATTDVIPSDGNCTGTLTFCSGKCVDLGSDSNNCGACDRTCDAGLHCRGGICK